MRLFPQSISARIGQVIFSLALVEAAIGANLGKKGWYTLQNHEYDFS